MLPLLQIMVVTWSGPKHYLNQCWIIANWAVGNKFQLNSNPKCSDIHSRKSNCKMTAILSQLQCVNPDHDHNTDMMCNRYFMQRSLNANSVRGCINLIILMLGWNSSQSTVWSLVHLNSISCHSGMHYWMYLNIESRTDYDETCDLHLFIFGMKRKYM